MYSDTNRTDIERHGNDLLARIEELTLDQELGTSGNGWRMLLKAIANQLMGMTRLSRDGRDVTVEPCEWSQDDVEIAGNYCASPDFLFGQNKSAIWTYFIRRANRAGKEGQWISTMESSRHRVIAAFVERGFESFEQ